MRREALNTYTPDEMRAKIASHDYNSELLLMHAMHNIAELERRSQQAQVTGHQSFGYALPALGMRK